ncbi:hypothetical protein vseg_001368 [Gypsophila vaccaria]
MAVAENGVVSSEQRFETTIDRSNFEDVIVDDETLEGKENVDDNNNNNNNHHNIRVLTENVTNKCDKDDVDSFNGDVIVDHDNDEDRGMKERKGGEEFKKEIRHLAELLSKLNPMAKEFVPPSLSISGGYNGFGYVNNVLVQPNVGVNVNGLTGKKKNNFANGKKRVNSRTSMAQREEIIRRTVYVSDIDQQVTEEQLASLFINCGQVVDCRVCGDPNSVLRFAFIEFTDEESAKNALTLSGTMLGFYPVKVLPSKTAIAPVNPTFLPRSEDEREMCARTVYCTNIDKKIAQGDLKMFFETFCGEVYRLRMLGDYHHSTRIAFVEFVMAESAIAALNCSGAVLGTLPIRVSPSKTPVRPRSPRSP